MGSQTIIQVMFKKSPKTKQFDMFSSPSGLLCERDGRLYDDPSAWHNTFYRDVTSNGKRLLPLGIVIDYILTHFVSGIKSLLERVLMISSKKRKLEKR